MLLAARRAPIAFMADEPGATAPEMTSEVILGRSWVAQPANPSSRDFVASGHH
jgi:hypothetical protein